MRVLSRLHHGGLIGRNRKFLPIYLAGLFSAIHYCLILYINSSYLENFFGKFEVATLFALGSILSLVVLLSSETFFKQINLRSAFTTTAVLEILAVTTMSSAETPILVGLGFIVHQAAIVFLFYVLDIILEREIKDETNTGEVRGMFLTVGSVAFVITPLFLGFALESNGYAFIYMLSVFFLFLAIPAHFSHKTDHHLLPIHHAPVTKDMRMGIFLNFLLQFFYAWMIIWVPIHLHQNIGFAWTEVGIIFSVMLLPFVLFELPLGELADRMFGEKEIMSIGFFLIAVSTAMLSIISISSILVWALALFMTRTGASAVEIATESYFFKHIKGRETGTVGIFRATRPVSYLVSPMIGATSIYILGPYTSFVVLAGILFIGVFLSLRLKDTL